MTPLALLGVTRRLAPDQAENFTAARCGQIFARRAGVVEQRLADGRPFLTGERFTIADISVGYALHYATRRELDALIPPGAMAYLDRLRSRPAFQRAAAV